MNKTKLAIMIAAAILILSIVVVSWIDNEKAQRVAMQNVELQGVNVQIQSIGLSDMILALSLTFYNPNSRVTATLDRMDLQIYANDIYLGNVYLSQREDIPPMQYRTISTSLRVSYTGALSAIWSALVGGQVNWGVRGTAYFDTPIGTINIPIYVSSGR